MKNHTEFLPQLAAFHDGALSAGQRESVASHVRDCPMCQRLLDDWKALDSALKTLPDPTVDTDGITAQVLDRISPQAKTATSVRPARAIRVPVRIWASAAAAAVILVAASLFLRQNDPTPDNPAFATRNLEPTPASPIEPSAITTHDKVDATAERQTVDASLPSVEPVNPTSAPPALANQSVPEISEPAGNIAGSKTLADQSSSAAASDQSTSEDSGILQSAETSARLAEFVAPEGPDPIKPHYRVPDLLDPAIVDVNLRPVFAVAFEGIGYAPTDMLAEAYDPSQSVPRRLSPQVAYLVSSMRMERSVLLSRTTNQIRTPETQLRLAEITWRLANMTADQDDVRNAIAAQTAAMRTLPSITAQSMARLAHLRSLQQ